MATETQSTPRQSEQRTPELTRTGLVYRPMVDILEKPDELVILADMPGTRPDQIDINFKEGALTILGRVEERQPGKDYLLREYGVGDFYRVFQVSEDIDPSRITAEYKDGVLTIHLPKAERAKARKIQVQAS